MVLSATHQRHVIRNYVSTTLMSNTRFAVAQSKVRRMLLGAPNSTKTKVKNRLHALATKFIKGKDSTL